MSRELLEKAAKAAGIQVRWYDGDALRVHDKCNGFAGKWNPLADDGDAFRLAVKLNLHASRSSSARVGCWREKAPFDSDEPGHDIHVESAECWFGEEMREYASRYGLNWRPCQLAATRLAIVCAAAAMEDA